MDDGKDLIQPGSIRAPRVPSDPKSPEEGIVGEGFTLFDAGLLGPVFGMGNAMSLDPAPEPMSPRPRHDLQDYVMGNEVPEPTAGGGIVTGGGAALTVEEQDGTPSVADVDTIKVPNGTLTDLGSGDISLSYEDPANKDVANGYAGLDASGLVPPASGGTGAGALTQGSVPFIGSGGVYSQDNANLFWDDTNNRLGIGTATPGQALDVRGAAVFNEDGDIVDFRVESDTDTHALFVDGSTDRVHVGGSAGAYKFNVEGGANNAVAGFSSTINRIDFRCLDETAATGGAGVLFSWDFLFRDSASNLDQYGHILLHSDTATSGSEDGRWEFEIIKGGAIDTSAMELGATAAVFNEGGVDLDFRVEGLTESHLLFVDAGNDRVGVGTDSPSSVLDVDGEVRVRRQGTTDQYCTFEVGDRRAIFHSVQDEFTGTAGGFQFDLGGASGQDDAFLVSQQSDLAASAPSNVLFHVDASGEVRISPSSTEGYRFNGTGLRIQPAGMGGNPAATLDVRGNAIFNEDGADNDFRVEGDTEGHLLFVDAGLDRVGINESAPSGKLHVSQSSATGALPVLHLDQADVSEEFVRLTGSAAAATLTQSLVNEADVDAFTTKGYLKVNIQDEGNQITDGNYYIPFGTIA